MKVVRKKTILDVKTILLMMNISPAWLNQALKTLPKLKLPSLNPKVKQGL